MPEESSVNTVTVPVRWESTDGAPTIYANQMFITHAGNEFYLVFGEIEPIFQIDKDNLPDHLSVHPRVKIAVTAQDMLEFAHVIQENVTRYQNRETTSSQGGHDEP